MTSVFDHPWLGGLFSDAQVSAIWSPERQISHLLTFEAAYSRALGVAGKVPNHMAEQAALMIETFEPNLTDLKAGTLQDGLPIPYLVAQIRIAAGKNEIAVHHGATSQDVIDTALALTLRELTVQLDQRLVDLSMALADLTKRFGDRSIMGRTRMQAALPITVSDRIATWMLPLDDHRIRLAQLRPRVERLQLGGPVGNRASMDDLGQAIADDMAARLGLGNPPRAWHAMRDNVVEYAGLLSLVTGTLGKMGQDVCLMAQQGIDEITIKGGGRSSAMPHKQNPILAELLVTLAKFNATQISGMHQALIHEQERSGAAWALEWMLLPQMAASTARSLTAANELCVVITNMGNCR